MPNETRIVKVQVSLNGSGLSGGQVLLYDRTRDWQYEGAMTKPLLDLMAGRLKAFYYGTLPDRGGDIELGDEAPWQEW